MASIIKAVWKLLSFYVISQMLAFLPAVRQWQATSRYGSGLSGAPVLFHHSILSQWRDRSSQKGHKTRRILSLVEFFSTACTPLSSKNYPRAETKCFIAPQQISATTETSILSTQHHKVFCCISSAASTMAIKAHPERRCWVEQQISTPPPALSWHFDNIILPSQN